MLFSILKALLTMCENVMSLKADSKRDKSIKHANVKF